jgi:hypothetical protein
LQKEIAMVWRQDMIWYDINFDLDVNCKKMGVVSVSLG